MAKKQPTAFESGAAEQQGGIVSEFIALMKENKKYWLIPIVLVLLILGLLVVLGGTGLAPFIYTLF